jgi:hypothetical protein
MLQRITAVCRIIVDIRLLGVMEMALIVTSAEVLSYKPAVTAGKLASKDLAWSV